MTCQPVALLDYITGLWEAGGLTASNASSMFVRDSFLVCGLRLPVRVCRAVFQVVFVHPGLWEEAGDDWRAAAGFVLNSD
jgi:hypothetical protein